MPIFRILLTFVIVLVALGLNFVWQSIESPVTGQAAVLQLDDSVAGYALAKRATEHIPQKAITYGAGALLVILWVPFLLRRREINRDAAEEEEDSANARI